MIKDFEKDYYSGLKGLYFYRILKTIISLGKLDQTSKIILDFGSGTGKLKELLGNKVVNYDVIKSQSDVPDWRKVKFDFFVANEVFYLLTGDQIRKALNDIRTVNPRAELIVGIARERLISKILANLAGEPDAHADSQTTPANQLQILLGEAQILERKTVFYLCDIYRLRLRRRSNSKR